MDFLKSKPLKGYFDALDGLRAIAILLVMLNHFVISLPDFLEFFRERGHLGVEVFFGVSGFLVMRSYHICFSKNQGFGWKTLKEFYFRRGLRIFFPFYLTLMALTIMALFVPSFALKIQGIKNILWSFPLYLFNYAKPFAGGTVPGVLNIMWSLAFEEQFYILLGLCCVFFRKSLGRTLLVLALLSIVIRFVTVFFDPAIGFNRLQFETHMRLDSILFGCLGYIYFSKLAIFFQKQKVKLCVYLGAVGAFIYGGWAESAFEVAISFTATSVFFTGMVVAIVADSNSFLAKLFARKPLVKIGKVSYEIYLVHQIINAVLVKLGVSKSPLLYGVTLIFLSCCTAILWFEYINKPVQGRLRVKFISGS